MATNSLQTWYLISGGNASTEKSYMQIDTTYSFAVNGSTTTVTCDSTMKVKRDSYSDTWNVTAVECWIKIGSAEKKYVIANGASLPRFYANTWTTIGSSVRHTFTYPSGTASTAAITAGFSISSNGSSKLKDFTVPTSNYSRGTAGIQSGSATLTLPLQATSCTAPSSISAASTRIGRGKVATINWSGASAGVSNSITGYRVYMKAGSQPTTTSNDNWWDTTGNSFTTPSLTTTQGTIYYFKILTRCSNSSFWSPISTGFTSVTINTTPTISAINPSSSTFASRDEPTIAINFTRADTNGDTITAYLYRVSGTTYTKLAETTGSSFNYTFNSTSFPHNTNTNGNDTTSKYAIRVFDSYDGVGGSYYSEKDFTLTRKAKVHISSMNVTAAHHPVYYTSGGKGTEPFCLSINTTRTASGTLSAYQWTLRKSTSKPSVNTASLTVISTSSTLSGFNVNDYVSFGEFYQIGLRISNEYEWSEYVWKISGYSTNEATATTAFYKAPQINIVGASNKHSTHSANSTLSTFANTNPGDFYSQVAIKYTYNSLYTRTFEARASGSTNWLTIGAVSSNGYGANFTLSPSDSSFITTSRTTWDFRVKSSYGNKSINSGTTSMAKIITNPLANVKVKAGMTNIKPIHTNAQSGYTMEFTKFWGTNNLQTHYDMPADQSLFKVRLEANNYSEDVLYGSAIKPSTMSTDTMQWPYTGQEVFSFAKDNSSKWNLSFNQDYSARFIFYVGDYFGNWFSVPSDYFTLSLKEAPRFPSSIVSIKYNRGTGLITIPTDTSTSTPTIINEGNKLAFTIPAATTYQGTTLIYKLYICRSSTALTDITKGTYTSYGSPITSSTTTGTLTFNHTVTQITTPYYCYFKVEVEDPVSQKATLYYTSYTITSGKLQNIPLNDLVIKNGAIDDTQKVLSFSYDLKSLGAGLANSALPYANLDNSKGLVKVTLEYSFDGTTFTTAPAALFDATTHAAMSPIVSSATRNSSLTLTSPAVGSFIYMRLKVQVQAFTGATDSTIKNPVYTTYSNTIAISNVQPTVAYRKNYLGINENNIAAGDVLVINVGPNDRKIVRLKSANYTATINLETGEIDNFIIKGKTW